MAPDGIRKRLLEFPAMGKIPVLAHPERYFCVQDTPELLYEFREMGAVLQINKGSVFGRFGEEAERTARFLLETALRAVWQAMPTEPITGPRTCGQSGSFWRSGMEKRMHSF